MNLFKEKKAVHRVYLTKNGEIDEDAWCMVLMDADAIPENIDDINVRSARIEKLTYRLLHTPKPPNPRG